MTGLAFLAFFVAGIAVGLAARSHEAHTAAAQRDALLTKVMSNAADRAAQPQPIPPALLRDLGLDSRDDSDGPAREQLDADESIRVACHFDDVIAESWRTPYDQEADR